VGILRVLIPSAHLGCLWALLFIKSKKGEPMKRTLIIIVVIVVFGWIIAVQSEKEERQRKIDLANKVESVTTEHEIRSHSMVDPADDRLWIPEVRTEYHTYVDYECTEAARYTQEIDAAYKMYDTNAEMDSAAKADTDATTKFCTDLSQLLNTLDNAVWVPGVSGHLVVEGEETRNKILAEAKQVEEDANTCKATGDAADKDYAQKLKELRGN
jgi:hypothetical protein